MPHPAVEEIERIAAMEDPAARNRLITRAYWRLSNAVADVIPGGANWCTFAAWASRQAGQSIRREDLGKALASRLKQDPVTRHLLGVLPLRGVDAMAALDGVLARLEPFRASSDAVARGNLLVFEEVAPEFARFLNAFPDGETNPSAAPLLQDAVRNYQAAYRAGPGKDRAERMLLANLQIGFHEQTRLQPEIEQGLNAVAGEPGELGRRVAAALLPGPAGGVVLSQACRLLGERIRQVARMVITDRLMSLELPGKTVRLGRDIPDPYPPDLERLDHPDLAALVAMIDPTPTSTRESGAGDWASFPERMHFIADLFRTHHHKQELFLEPA